MLSLPIRFYYLYPDLITAPEITTLLRLNIAIRDLQLWYAEQFGITRGFSDVLVFESAFGLGDWQNNLGECVNQDLNRFGVPVDPQHPTVVFCQGLDELPGGSVAYSYMWNGFSTVSQIVIDALDGKHPSWRGAPFERNKALGAMNHELGHLLLQDGDHEEVPRLLNGTIIDQFPDIPILDSERMAIKALAKA